MMGFGFGMMGILGPLMMLGFWLPLIALVVWAIGSSGGAGTRATGYEEPLEILKRRLASGQITPAEYEQARKVLQG